MQFLKKSTFFKEFSVILMVAISLFFIFHFVFQFNGLYGQDSHAYYQYSILLSDWLNGEQPDFGFFFWPKLFPFLGALISLSGISSLSALQLISFLSFVGTLAFTLKIITLLYKKSGLVFIILGAMTQIYFMRGGFLVMSDMLTTFFCTAAIYFYLQFLKNENWITFFLLLGFIVAAFFTRYTSVVLLSIPAIHVCTQLLKRVNRLKQIIVLALTLGGIVFLFMMNGQFMQSLWFVVDTWTPLNIFTRTFHTPDGIVTNTVPNGLYVFGNFFHFGYLSFGLLLLPFFKQLRNSNRVLVLTAFVYLLFLAGHPMQNYRFLMIVHPIVLIILFPLFHSLVLWLKSKRLFVVFVIGVIVFNLGFAWYSFQKTLKVHSVELEVVKSIQKQNHSGTIYSFYVDQSFKSYGIENQVNNFFYKDYPTFEKGSLVVFNEQKFEKQWKGHKVMRNWQRLKSNYHLDTLSLLSDNWVIYRIK